MNHDTPEAIAITDKAARELLVREKLLKALNMVLKATDWHIDPPKDSYGAHAYATVMTAIKEAEAL